MKCNEVELGDFLFVCHEKTVLRPFDILWLSRLCVEPLVWKTENGLKFPLKISSSVPDIPAEPGFWLKKPHGKTHQQKVVVKNFPEYFHITIITSHESGGVPKVLYPRFFFFGGLFWEPKTQLLSWADHRSEEALPRSHQRSRCGTCTTDRVGRYRRGVGFKEIVFRGIFRVPKKRCIYHNQSWCFFFDCFWV